MPSTPKFYQDSVDLDLFRQKFSQQSLGTTDLVHPCAYLTEQGQHPELKALHDVISSKTELTTEERINQCDTLITYLSRLTPETNITLSEDDRKLPLTDKVKEYLAKIKSSNVNNRHIGMALAQVVLGLSENKPLTEIKTELDNKLTEIHNHMLDQVARDATRTNISFKKDKEVYDLGVHGSSSTGIPAETLREKIIELNNEKGLNLTGEQIDYTILCLDQAGMIGAPIFRVQTKNITLAMLAPSNIISESNFLIDTSNDQVVLRYNNAFKLIDITNPSAPDAVKGLELYTASADLTALKGSSMRIGLASAHVPVRLDFSCTLDPKEFAIDPALNSRGSDFDHVREYCRIKVQSQVDLDSLEKQAKFLIDLTPPKILNETMQELQKEKNLNLEQICKLSAKVSLAKTNQGQLIDLSQATKQFTSLVEGLEPAKVRRYLLQEADKAKIKTNATFFERVNNFFADIGDWFKGRTTPEQKLAPNMDLNVTTTRPEEKNITTSPHETRSHSNELSDPELNATLEGKTSRPRANALSSSELSSEISELEKPSITISEPSLTRSSSRDSLATTISVDSSTSRDRADSVASFDSTVSIKAAEERSIPELEGTDIPKKTKKEFVPILPNLKDPENNRRNTTEPANSIRALYEAAPKHTTNTPPAMGAGKNKSSEGKGP